MDHSILTHNGEVTMYNPAKGHSWNERCWADKAESILFSLREAIEEGIWNQDGTVEDFEVVFVPPPF